MGPEFTRRRRRFAGLGVLGAVFWGAAFAAAYGQAPLYYSNQNQYLLHGLADAGRGDLAHDWFAATTGDPTPVFSATIAWLYTHAGEWSFYAVFAVLQAIYFVSLVALIDATLGLPRSRPARFVLLTLLVAVHSLAARWASLYVTGTLVPMYLHRPMDALDLPRYLQFGVAGQYLLGPGLQPSAFGVFLITSMAAFARGLQCRSDRGPRTEDRQSKLSSFLCPLCLLFSAVFIGIACSFHPSSLLPAALITAAYVLVLLRNGRWLAAISLGALILLAVSPIVQYMWAEFGPTTAEQSAEAQRLLVDVRIPHHAQVSHWFDRFAKFQIFWVAVGILFSLRTRLFGLLAIPAILSAILTLAQVAPGNLAITDWLRAHGMGQEALDKLTVGSRTLALLFPWRVSVVLVPVATAVIVTRVVAALTPYPGRPAWWAWAARIPAAILFVAVVAGALYITLREPGLIYPPDNAELPLLSFVESHRQSGDLYLIPVDELERFRLLTGAAVYVEWKSVPYKDVDVLEWWRRVEQAKQWYAAGDWDAIHDELRKAGITNVVMPAAAAPVNARTLEREYADGVYVVYRLRP